MYFNHINDIVKLKETYRTLSKVYHPDTGGDTEKFKELLAEYKSQETFILTGRKPIDKSSLQNPQASSQTTQFSGNFFHHPFVQEIAFTLLRSLADSLMQPAQNGSHRAKPARRK